MKTFPKLLPCDFCWAFLKLAHTLRLPCWLAHAIDVPSKLQDLVRDLYPSYDHGTESNYLFVCLIQAPFGHGQVSLSSLEVCMHRFYDDNKY